MKLSRALTLLCILTLVPCILHAQYSPYYFYDSLKDDGIQSQEHYHHLGKIFMDVHPEYGVVNDSAGVQTMAAKSSLDAQLYLKRSLKYYYIKNLFDTLYNSKDWDFVKFKPQIKTPPHWVGNPPIGFFVFVLLCDGDTVSSWKMVVRGDEFTSKTAFEIRLWSEAKGATDDTYFFPLVDYVGKKKLTGIHEISMFVYPGKIQCNRVADRGKECLANGKIKMQITNEDLTEVLDQKLVKKPVFPACENGHNLVKLK